MQLKYCNSFPVYFFPIATALGMLLTSSFLYDVTWLSNFSHIVVYSIFVDLHTRFGWTIWKLSISDASEREIANSVLRWQYVSVKCVADSNFHRDKNWTTGLKLFLYYSEEYREIVVILGRSSEAMQISKSVILSFICSSRIWPRIYTFHFTLQRFSCSQYVFLQIFWVF